METKRLKRIKPQPVPRRRLPWRRERDLPARAQNAEDELAVLLAQFTRATRLRRPIIPRRGVGPLALILSAVLIALISSVLPVSAPWLSVIGLTVLLLVMLLLMCFTVSDRLLGVSQQLSGCDDVRAIPSLIRVLAWPEARARIAAGHALIRLLPRLQLADADLLDTPARRFLHRRLWLTKTVRGQDVALAILKALESVGDDRDLQVVTALAGRNARNAAEQRLQEAAQSCLRTVSVSIRQRMAEQRDSPPPTSGFVACPPAQVCSALKQEGDTQETTLQL